MIYNPKDPFALLTAAWALGGDRRPWWMSGPERRCYRQRRRRKQRSLLGAVLDASPLPRKRTRARDAVMQRPRATWGTSTRRTPKPAARRARGSRRCAERAPPSGGDSDGCSSGNGTGRTVGAARPEQVSNASGPRGDAMVTNSSRRSACREPSGTFAGFGSAAVEAMRDGSLEQVAADFGLPPVVVAVFARAHLRRRLR